MWQYVQNLIETKLNEDMNTLYKKTQPKTRLTTKQTGNKNTQRKYTNREQRTNKLDQYTFHQGTNQHIKNGPAICNRKDPEILYK
jgi:hypothetical protein